MRRCDGDERRPEGEGDQGWRGQAEGEREEEGKDEREEDAATRCARESVRLKREKVDGVTVGNARVEAPDNDDADGHFVQRHA